MTAYPSRGSSLRSARVLLAVLATGWLAGCASLPQPLSNALGRIPVVSLLIDRAQVEEMA
ncbi:MAG: hypothetical protein IT499_23970, partial [Rubrivivax sp.]|nr:hypothetical protein [Rubrivivax sp.]